MTHKRPRLLLVNPRLGYKHYGAQDELSHLMGRKKMSLPLALPLLAALTPPNYQIEIVDDETEPLPIHTTPDIVGITTLVSTIDRAREIAGIYKSMGSHIVVGGSYATFRPDEILSFADTVVVGEAEGVFAEFLADFENGKPERRYERTELLPFDEVPSPPRWDLVNTKELMTLGIQTSRGCPHHCEFCLAHKMFGRKMRFRNIDNVVAEIKSLPLKKLFFVDDNLTIKKSYARKLMAALKPLDISWVCQAGIDVADDEELLAEMAEAGCLSILIGFESLNPKSLGEAQKEHNKIANYKKAIHRIHKNGINVLASFVVGFDSDTLETFQHIENFLEESDVIYSMLSVLAAAPGTDLYTRMEEAGRLIGYGNSFINGAFPCIAYKNFSGEEVLDGYFESLRRMYDYDSLYNRAMRLFETGSFRVAGGGEKVSSREKIKTSLLLMKRFLFSANPSKRRLFKDLFAMVRRKTLSPESAVIFLLSAEAVHDYLFAMEKELDTVRQTIRDIETVADNTI